MKKTHVDPWRERKQASFFNRATLACAGALRHPLQALGVDYPRFRLLFEQRLRLDARQGSSRKQQHAANVALTLAACLVAGALPSLVVLLGGGARLWIAVGQAQVLFFSVSLLLAFYGAVLLDATDVAVHSGLPISDRTLFASRLAQIGALLAGVSAASALAPSIAGVIALGDWRALLVFPACTVLTTLTALGFVALLHALTLRLFGPVRFQRASLWVQVGAATALAVGFQIVPRMVDWQGAAGRLQQRSWLDFALPPLHGTALYDLAQGDLAPRTLGLAALALALPVLGLWLALSGASKSFAAAISGTGAAEPAARDPWRLPRIERACQPLLRTAEERAAFGWALALSRRERPFVRVVYPQLGTLAAVGIALAVSLARKTRADLDSAAFALYFLPQLAILVVAAGQCTESAAAAWIFDFLPVARRSRARRGAIMALVFGTALPALLLLALAAGAVAGFGNALDLALALELATAATLLVASWSRARMPFSIAPMTSVMTGNLFLVLGAVAVSGALALLHALARLHWIAMLAAIVAALPLVAASWHSFSRALARPRGAD